MIVHATETSFELTQQELQYVLSDSESSLNHLNQEINDGAQYLQEKEGVIESRINTYESELDRLQNYYDYLKAEYDRMDKEIDRLIHEIHCAEQELSHLAVAYKKEGESEYTFPDSDRAIALNKQIDQMQGELRRMETKYNEVHHNLQVVEESLNEVRRYLEEVLYVARDEYEMAVSSFDQMRVAIDKAFGNWMPTLKYVIEKVQRLKEYLEEFNSGTFSLNYGVKPDILMPHFAHTPVVSSPLPSFKREEKKPKEVAQVSIPPKMKWVTHDMVEIIGQYSSQSELESDIQKLPFLCTIRVSKIISTHLSCFQNMLELDDFMKRLRFSAKRTMFGTRYVDGKGYIYFVGRE